MNLWIKNGHVLDPANHLDEVCDVYVKEGKVACVGSLSSDKIPDECTVIDAEGKYCLPWRRWFVLHSSLYKWKNLDKRMWIRYNTW